MVVQASHQTAGSGDRQRCAVDWWTFFEAHAWRSTMELEDRHYFMALNSCIPTLYVGHVCPLRSSLNAVEYGHDFAERLGWVAREAGM